MKKCLGSMKKCENISKLYGVFQAWKYQVKEAKLLKKYLDEAESEDVEFDRDVQTRIDRSSMNCSMEQTSRFQGLASQLQEDY